MIRALVVAGLVFGCSSCSAPCDTFTVNGEAACIKRDAGAPRADAPFKLTFTFGFAGSGLIGEPCEVQVDGGLILATIPGSRCTGGLSSNYPIATAREVECTIPALPAGDYKVAGTSFTLLDGGSETQAFSTCL